MKPVSHTIFVFALICISFSLYSQQNGIKSDSLKIVSDTAKKKTDPYAKYFQLIPSPLPPEYLFNFKDTVFESPNERKIIPNIFFDFNKHTIRPESYDMLDSLYEYLKIHPDYVVDISGHTDTRSSDKYSVKLSQRRAQSVIDYLAAKGIKKERIIAKGYDKYEPLILKEGMNICGTNITKETILNHENVEKLSSENKNCEECLHQLNRRICIKIISYGK